MRKPLSYFVFFCETGRCARAGRSGTAYSIVCPDEYSYLIDLHLFLGRPLHVMPSKPGSDVPEGAIGKMPQSMVEEQLAELILWHGSSSDLVGVFYLIKQFFPPFVKTIIKLIDDDLFTRRKILNRFAATRISSISDLGPDLRPIALKEWKICKLDPRVLYRNIATLHLLLSIFFREWRTTDRLELVASIKTGR